MGMTTMTLTAFGVTMEANTWYAIVAAIVAVSICMAIASFWIGRNSGRETSLAELRGELTAHERDILAMWNAIKKRDRKAARQRNLATLAPMTRAEQLREGGTLTGGMEAAK